MSVRTTSGKGPEVHKANYTGITSRPQDQKWSFSTPTHADTKPGMKVAAGAQPESGVRRAAGVSQDLLPPDGSQRVLVGKQLCLAPHARGDGDENYLLVRRR